MADGNPTHNRARVSSEKRKPMALVRFLCGLPAVIVAAIATFAVLFGNETPRARLVGDYSSAAAKARDDDRLIEAELYYRKVVSLEPFNDEYQYNLALVAEEMENPRRAWALMSRIAPEDKIGYGEAHFWQALKIYDVARQPNSPSDTGDRLEHHLLATIKRMGDRDQAHMMLGQLYLTQAMRQSDAELLQKAKLHLTEGIESYPENRISVAELHRRMGETERAREQADASLAYYQEKLKEDPKDLATRLRVAQAQKFLFRFGSAIKTLHAGLPLTDDPRLRQALATAYLTAARAVELKQPGDVAKQLELLQEALKLDPDNKLILTTFAALTAHSDPAADAAREGLRNILEQGKAPATVHLILGSIAVQRGRDKEATYHLNQALELNPRMPEVLNNLAWHLAFSEPPQLDRALDLANRAAELRPSDVEILDTRGQILLKMGRHQEALKDLLIAVRRFPNRPKTNESLAKIYEHLGDTPMAQRHRKRANPIAPGSDGETTIVE